jgi:DNA-binding XRE family transcriptional regulator
MSGPHPLWDDEVPSPAKRERVTSRRTQLQMAQEVGCSLMAYHNLESRGLGSAHLWARVAEVLQVPVEAIKPIAPARGNGVADLQLILPGASSS